MTRKDEQSGGAGGDLVGPRLQQALRRLYGSPARSSMERDTWEGLRLALDAEWNRLARQQRRRRVLIRSAAAAAAISGVAAAIALLVVVGLPGGGGLGGAAGGGPLASSEHAPEAPPAPADIDASGRIDMLDAFILARAIEAERSAAAGGELDSLWDITGDGTVDAADVDAVAMRAVRLDEPDASEAGGAG